MDASGSDGFAFISSSAATTVKHNAIYRSYGGINIGHAITVRRQNGQARGSFPTTHGGTGVELGAILATLGSPGIPSPIRPGSDTGTLQGGVVQFIGKETVDVGATITADAAAAPSGEGGGGGGLVVIISDTLIAGSSNISVAAVQGHDTAGAKGGGGGYSGEPGGHAGYGGSGGGQAGGGVSVSPGAAGAGYIALRSNQVGFSTSHLLVGLPMFIVGAAAGVFFFITDNQVPASF
jgi:hypothetical protein